MSAEIGKLLPPDVLEAAAKEYVLTLVKQLEAKGVTRSQTAQYLAENGAFKDDK
jgi:hypothetical protein